MANTYNGNMPLDTHEFLYMIYNLYTNKKIPLLLSLRSYPRSSEVPARNNHAFHLALSGILLYTYLYGYTDGYIHSNTYLHVSYSVVQFYYILSLSPGETRSQHETIVPSTSFHLEYLKLHIHIVLYTLYT